MVYWFIRCYIFCLEKYNLSCIYLENNESDLLNFLFTFYVDKIDSNFMNQLDGLLEYIKL